MLVALDDAGASDAGFLVASQVRLDIIKLDKLTVDRITGRELSPAETSALWTLIRATKVAVIAEGVESEYQVGRLRSYGIGAAQGWLFSYPLAAADFMEYFSAHQ
jgi:EAL domain-containing protein (putative c-di-GMP-specific phosphodiesterase class I)